MQFINKIESLISFIRYDLVPMLKEKWNEISLERSLLSRVKKGDTGYFFSTLEEWEYEVVANMFPEDPERERQLGRIRRLDEKAAKILNRKGIPHHMPDEEPLWGEECIHGSAFCNVCTPGASFDDYEMGNVVLRGNRFVWADEDGSPCGEASTCPRAKTCFGHCE